MKMVKQDAGTAEILRLLRELRSDLLNMKLMQQKILRRLNELEKMQRALKDIKEVLCHMSEV